MQSLHGDDGLTYEETSKFEPTRQLAFLSGAPDRVAGSIAPMGIAENLTEARRKAGLSQIQLADRSGVSQQLISQIERGLNSSTKHLPALARALDCQIGDLDGTYAADIRAAPSVQESGDDTMIPVYDVQASAGNGSHVDSEAVLCNMAFNRSFLRRMTDAGVGDLAIIRVKGHSMEPTLLDDDHVLVDRTKRNLAYDGMFVLRFDDVLHVKRIGRSSKRGNVMVTSDNPAYDRLDMSREDIDVIGRVLWVGRKV